MNNKFFIWRTFKYFLLLKNTSFERKNAKNNNKRKNIQFSHNDYIF
jgi:hypothetical protein